MKPTRVSHFVFTTVLMLAGMAVFSSCSKAPKTFGSLNEKMQQEAKVVAETFNQETGLNLDFSVTSLKYVEQRLAKLAASVGKTDPQAAQTHAFSYGAYVGECLRKKHGGEWAEEAVDGKTTLKVKTPTGAALTPVAWCFERITGTEKENIYKKVVAETKTLGAEAAPAGDKK
jgi:hypothetical protein